MTKRTFRIQQLEDHATALGYLCFMYADLELSVSKLIGSLLGMKGARLDALTNQTDMKQEIEIAKALAFAADLPNAWYQDVELVLWHIGTIAPRRNRCVHDRWFPDSTGQAIRRWYRNKIGQAQSHQPLTLTTREDVPHSACEIWQLVDEIMVANGALDGLRGALRPGHSVRLLPQVLRDQWSAQRKPLPESSPAAQKQPPKSSSKSPKQKPPSRRQRREQALGRRGSADA